MWTWSVLTILSWSVLLLSSLFSYCFMFVQRKIINSNKTKDVQCNTNILLILRTNSTKRSTNLWLCHLKSNYSCWHVELLISLVLTHTHQKSKLHVFKHNFKQRKGKARRNVWEMSERYAKGSVQMKQRNSLETRCINTTVLIIMLPKQSRKYSVGNFHWVFIQNGTAFEHALVFVLLVCVYLNNIYL